jgi:hypothetical protein
MRWVYKLGSCKLQVGKFVKKVGGRKVKKFRTTFDLLTCDLFERANTQRENTQT